jgi:hypothetical protein
MSHPADLVAADVHELLAARLRALLPGAALDQSQGVIVLPLHDGEHARVPTASLLGSCATRPPEDWPALVDGWLREIAGAVLAAADAAQEQAVAGSDQAGLRERLRLRMVPKLDERSAEQLAVVPFGRYFDALLAVDHPDSMELLTRAQAAELGPADAVRQLAISNTVERELITFEVRDQPLRGAETVRTVAKEGSPYVSSALLAVQRLLADPAPYGALVAVPRYSLMLLHEVASDRALDFVATFHVMARSKYLGAPDPCTPHVFWWLQGDLYAVGVTPGRRGRQRVELDPELAPLIEDLPRSHR